MSNDFLFYHFVFKQKTYEVEKFSLSHDKRFLLLVHDIRVTGHYSNLARYTVFDKHLHTTTPLRVGGTEDVNELHQHGVWVPGRNLIVLVNRNNIHLFDTRGEMVRIVTASGQEDGTIFNGVADMTYEEHVWQSSPALWTIGYRSGWALLYATIDSTAVDKLPFVEYGKMGNDSSAPPSKAQQLPQTTKTYQPGPQEGDHNYGYRIYPKVLHYPYPKPGKIIPRLTLSVSKFNEAGTDYIYRDVMVLPPQPYAKEYYLATRPTWVSPTEFVAIWAHRSQDQSIVTRCLEQSSRNKDYQWQCVRLVEEKLLRASSGSLVITSPPLVSASGTKIFFRLPVSDGVAGTFEHVALVTRDGKKQFLTHGQYVVTDLFGYREDLNTLYYAATAYDEPGVRHVYSLKHSNNSNEEKMIDCLSCRINSSCLYNSLSFSPNGRHFVLECLGPNLPIYYLVDVNNGSQVIETLHRSEQTARWTKERMIPKERHYSMLTPSGHRIRLQLIIPSFVNELDDAKYPLVIETNRLPGQQSVDYRNRLDWARYLTSSRDYVTARIDTRGSNYQGFRYMFSVYRRLGELEVEDLSFALAYIKHLPYIDSNKIAVVGSELGGHLAASLLAKEKAITCGVVVAPIASLKNYLATFSERFMSLPEDNYLGYEHSELRLQAPLLKGKNLLIVHGTLNRRVNLQHTMQFTKALIDNNVQYRTQVSYDHQPNDLI